MQRGRRGPPRRRQARRRAERRPPACREWPCRWPRRRKALRGTTRHRAGAGTVRLRSRSRSLPQRPERANQSGQPDAKHHQWQGRRRGEAFARSVRPLQPEAGRCRAHASQGHEREAHVSGRPTGRGCGRGVRRDSARGFPLPTVCLSWAWFRRQASGAAGPQAPRPRRARARTARAGQCIPRPRTGRGQCCAPG